MRAPAARISSIRSWWRGRSRTIVVTSFTRRPNASAIAWMFSPTGRIRSIAPRALGPTAIFRMYMSGSVMKLAGIADGDHRHRAVAAARDDAAALERVEREVDLRAARADDRARREPLRPRDPRTTRPRSAGSRATRASPSPPPPPLPPGRRGRASAPRRAPRARSRADTTGTWHGRVPAVDLFRAGSSQLSPSPAPLGGGEDELDHVGAACSASSFSITGMPFALGAPDDERLQPADLVEVVEVVATRPLAALVAREEVLRVLVLVLDREDERADDRAVDLGRQRGPDEMDALEHDRPSLLQRALDRRADADEDVARLLEEAGDSAGRRRRARRRRPRSSSGGSPA